MGGTACSHRVTPACSERTLQLLKSSKSYGERAVLAGPCSSSWKRHGGQVTPRGVTGYRGGEPSESEIPRALPA
jgi:hypothetical protein